VPRQPNTPGGSLEDQRKAKIKEEVREHHLDRLREETPSELQLLQEKFKAQQGNQTTHWPRLPAADPAYLFDNPLDQLGFPEGSEEFEAINQGISWKCQARGPSVECLQT
jgi:hypothetical protein